MPHQATAVVAVGVRQENVVDADRGHGTFSHIDAEIEFGELQIGGESRYGKSAHLDLADVVSDLA